MREVITPEAALSRKTRQISNPIGLPASARVYRLKDKLQVVLDVDRLLDFYEKAAA